MKRLLIFGSGIIIGFFIHALIFPEVFTNGIIFPSHMTLTPQTQETTSDVPDLITTIEFTGTFSRHNITIEQSRYLAVVNKQKDTHMWLISDDKDFTTPRGYGYMEQLKKRMDEKGRVIIADKNNPSEKLVVTVK